jgi:hypothetical protein
MSKSMSTSAVVALGAGPEAPRESAKDEARRYLEELLAEKPELPDALSGVLSGGENDARGRGGAGPAERDGGDGEAPLARPRRLERAAASAPPHVCSWCRRVRVTPERWVPAADHAREHAGGRKSPGAGVIFHLATNGICPDCYLSVLGHARGCGCARGGQGGGHE